MNSKGQGQQRAGQWQWGPFRALPAYFGGKRRLCPPIFALLGTVVPQNRWSGLTFVDPFLGGGSVSLFAKARGFRVVCNDLALRSAAVGRALVANSSVTLSQADLLVLLRQPSGSYPRLAEQRYSPAVFPRRHALLLDRMLYNLESLCEPRRSLAILLLLKWTLRVQPMGMLRGTDARAAFEGDLDRVSPHRLRHYLNTETQLAPKAWLALAADVNSGVFPGCGEAFQEDALSFLAHSPGDIVYLDPPYPGTIAYEDEYAVLDDLLEGAARSVSPFSRSPDRLPVLLKACRHIPVWLISLNNAALELTRLLEMVKAHRKNVQAIEIPYRHLGGIASKEKNATNREFIIVATG